MRENPSKIAKIGDDLGYPHFRKPLYRCQYWILMTETHWLDWFQVFNFYRHTHSRAELLAYCRGLISFSNPSISKKSPCQSKRPKSNLSILPTYIDTYIHIHACMHACYAAAENMLFHVYEFPHIPDPEIVVACLCGSRCVLGSGMVEALDSARCLWVN